MALKIEGGRRSAASRHVISVAAPPRPRRGLNTKSYTVGIVTSDFLLAWASLAIGLYLLSLLSRNPVNRLSNFWVNYPHGTMFPLGIVLGMALSGMYRMSRRSPTQSTFTELQNYTMGVTFGGVLALALSYIAHHYAYYTVQVATQVLAAMFVAVFLLPIGHAVLRHEVLRQSPVRVLIVDRGEGVARFTTHLRLNHGIQVVGWVATTESSSGRRATSRAIISPSTDGRWSSLTSRSCRGSSSSSRGAPGSPSCRGCRCSRPCRPR